MKTVRLLLLVLSVSHIAFAQRTVQIKNLWTRPQVHVLFEGYTLSFTIKDINKALALLAETGETGYGPSCGLDTAGNYYADLRAGTKMEYHNALQPLLQNGIGAYLLSQGHAYIENSRHKKLTALTMDIVPPAGDAMDAYVLFYDPNTGKKVFTGKMATGMYNKDMGID